ncbi:LysM peptidoglycan-binding domain-containing protein [Pararhodobacter zhoushanensis]|uniref:LysM peptidoglycan-binding domain-containing protein n=1 Tax=Pararhodobacter zhoushanensis TaxID=2479545 RepID=UPI001FE4D957|nr:LysM peptidoglycan-binding domain-containing protein [Pararhodobacter zhoushanensis]
MSRYLVWILGSGTLAAGSAVAVWLAMGMQDDRVAVAPEATPATPAVAPEPSTPPVAEEPAVVAPVPPGFDVVRVARDGAALVAGSAAPGAAVVLRVDGVERAQTSADSAGQFVAIFSLEPSDVPQVMTLEMLDAAGQVIVGEDTVILTPRPADAPVQIAAVDQPAADTVGLQTAVDGLRTADPQSEPLTGPSEAATSGEVADPASADTAATQAQGVSEGGATEPAPVEVASAPEAEPSAPPARDEPTTEVATDTTAPESVESSPVAGTESASATPDDSAPDTEGQTIASDAPQPTSDQPAVQAPVPGAPAADPAEAAPLEIASAEAGTRPTGAAPSEGGAAAPQTGQTAEASADPVQTDPVPDRTGPETASEPTVVASADSVPDSSRMPSAFLLRGDGQVTVLDRAPSVMDNVIIDSISYSSAGDVQIAGRAARANPDANLRIYLDNRPIAVAQAESGDWASDLPSIDPGVYTLRVDQVGTDGRVVSRFETPFQREAPEIVAAAQARAQQTAAVEQPVTQTAAVEPEASAESPVGARPVESAATTSPAAGTASTVAASVQEPVAPAADATPLVVTPRTLAQETPEGAPVEPSRAAASIETPVVTATASASAPPTAAAPQVSLITVQPGNTLWHISRERYGQGERYVVIYNANRSQIRDPDLIYPGQIFTLPTE